MPANDPCSAERKAHYEASVEFQRADEAYDVANEPVVMPLVREWSSTNHRISELKKNGDPEGRLQNLEAQLAKLSKKIEEASEHPAVKDTLHRRTVAKDKMDHLASRLSDCEQKHGTPSSPEPDAPAAEPTANPRSSGDSATSAASAGPDAPPNDAAREHHPGECWCGTTHPDHMMNWTLGPCWCGKTGVHNVGMGPR
jgi:hypothetical protein